MLLYLTCENNPQVCYERIQKRNRAGEEDITLGYIENVNSITDKLVQEWKYNKACMSTLM